MTLALQASSYAHTDAPKGTSFQFKWQAEVINLELLIAQALQDPGSRRFIAPNFAALKQYAESYQEDQTPEPVPGIRFVKVSSGTVRR